MMYIEYNSNHKAYVILCKIRPCALYFTSKLRRWKQFSNCQCLLVLMRSGFRIQQVSRIGWWAGWLYAPLPEFGHRCSTNPEVNRTFPLQTAKHIKHETQTWNHQRRMTAPNPAAFFLCAPRNSFILLLAVIVAMSRESWGTQGLASFIEIPSLWLLSPKEWMINKLFGQWEVSKMLNS